jgi:hypothetical protein
MPPITEINHQTGAGSLCAPATWPIRNDLSPGSLYPAEIAIPYSASVIAKGCRKPKIAWFVVVEKIGIRVVDAPTAFQIYFPKSSRFGANELEVLYFERKYWWPLHYNGARSCVRGSIGGSLASLRERKSDLLGLLPPGVEFPTQETSDVTLREIVSSEQEEAVARACRKIADNIVISNHRMYELGGEPVWIQRHEGHTPKIGIASIGAYRTDRGQGLRTQVGHFNRSDVQQCLQWGRFFPANDRASVVGWNAARGLDNFPEIDVLINDAVRCPSEQVQLDALVRSATDILSRYRAYEDLLPVSCTKQGLAFQSESVSDRELTRRRLILLRDFAQINQDHFHYIFMDDQHSLRGSIQNFDPARRITEYT